MEKVLIVALGAGVVLFLLYVVGGLYRKVDKLSVTIADLERNLTDSLTAQFNLATACHALAEQIKVEFEKRDKAGIAIVAWIHQHVKESNAKGNGYLIQ